jgi:putative exosortase-associated protein (TIGR04073 family)
LLTNGVLNVGTCFVDVVVNTVNGTKAGPPLVGTLTGAAKGLGCGVLRAASGVVDVATFWVPGFNGIPVSDSYEDCLLMGAPAFHGGASVEPSEPALEAWTMPTTSESPSSDVTAAPSLGETQPQAAPAKSQWKK